MTKTDELLRELLHNHTTKCYDEDYGTMVIKVDSFIDIIADLRKLITQVEGERMPSDEEREQSEKANKGIRLEKHTVCASCFSIGITDKDCVCTYSNVYPTIELEFEVCDSCGRIINDSNPADTPFNEEQFKALKGGE